jgi:hypothetical protein
MIKRDSIVASREDWCGFVFPECYNIIPIEPFSAVKLSVKCSKKRRISSLKRITVHGSWARALNRLLLDDDDFFHARGE